MGVVLQFPNVRKSIATISMDDVKAAVPVDSVSVKLDATVFREMLDTLAFYQVDRPDDGYRARVTLDRLMS